jgi:chromosomal replication initiator protein
MLDLWPKCLDELRKTLPSTQLDTWVKPLYAQLDHDLLILEAPNASVLRWAKNNLQGPATDTASRLAGKPIQIVLRLGNPSNPRLENDSTAPAIEEAWASGMGGAPVADPRRAPRDDHRLNRGFTFDSFVPGKANQLAHAAACQVASNLGSAYNPLFIYGATGLGKTHLLHAIGWQLLQANPDARIRYIHTEQFVTEVVAAYQNKSFDALKRNYRTLDLLLIDDIQFFIDKPRCQEEFFYTFNALFDSNKQVVLTSDAFPKEIHGIEERLKSRFGWGLTVAVEPPELEMRVAILKSKATSDGLKLDETVAFFIAQNVRSNVRELEGALKRVIAYARFTDQPITLTTAKESLRDLLAIVNRQISIESIQRVVADFFKIKLTEMKSKKRDRSVARPRQVAMSLAKELTRLSYPEIGEAFGNRDHTTVLHACRKIQQLREDDPGMAHDYEQLLQILER